MASAVDALAIAFGVVLVVGDVSPSSNSVSIARSSAPVDFAMVRVPYDVVAVDAERLL